MLFTSNQPITAHMHSAVLYPWQVDIDAGQVDIWKSGIWNFLVFTILLTWAGWVEIMSFVWALHEYEVFIEILKKRDQTVNPFFSIPGPQVACRGPELRDPSSTWGPERRGCNRRHTFTKGLRFPGRARGTVTREVSQTCVVQVAITYLVHLLFSWT